MRKVIIGIMAVAMLAIIPSAASADVARCEASVPISTTLKTATFTVTEPANAEHQFTNVWTHTYTVNVNDDNTFAGIGEITGSDSKGTYDEQVPHTGADEEITGKFGDAAGTTVSYVSTRPDGLAYIVNNAPTNGSLFLDTTFTLNGAPYTSQWSYEMKVSAPVITSATTTTPGTESVKNHGQFVKAQGGGKTAAQACAGMPLVSTQGSFLK